MCARSDPEAEYRAEKAEVDAQISGGSEIEIQVVSGPGSITTTTITLLSSMHLAQILRSLPYVVGTAEVRLDDAPPGEGVNLSLGAMSEVSERVELILGGTPCLFILHVD